MSVFISYSRIDKEKVLAINNFLIKHDVFTWIDLKKLQGGAEYDDDITDAIQDCDAFLLVISQNSLNSNYVKKEFLSAVRKDKKILPFFIEDCSLPGAFDLHLGSIHYFSAYNNWDEALNQLLEAIKVILKHDDSQINNKSNLGQYQNLFPNNDAANNDWNNKREPHPAFDADKYTADSEDEYSEYKKLTFTDGSVYEGDVVNGKPHGKGKMVFADGSTYEGEFSNGEIHGKGKMTYIISSDFQETIEGIFENRKIAKGTISFSNGNFYEGDIKIPRPHGKGKILFKSGARYEGHFNEGEFHGEGIYTWKEEDSIKGTFSNGKPHGTTLIYTFPNGTYVGEYINGEHTNYGTLVFNSDIYVGSFSDWDRNEIRKYTYLYGEDYCFLSAKIEGTGIYLWSDKTLYEGDFSSGEPNGHGKYTYPDGDVYEGEFSLGKKEGIGKYTWQDGSYYEGTFKKDKFAKGFEYDKDGNVIAKYVHGKRHPVKK